jgi:hypothetical protein
LDSDATRSDHLRSGTGAIEARALRELFGLTERTRRTTWRVRQEYAAQSLHMSWDHFRHSTQESLLRTVAEMLIATGRQSFEPPDITAKDNLALQAYPTQHDIEATLVSYIEEVRPRRATMLELSAATISPILLALRDVEAQIRLLVSNPEKYLSVWQERRIHASLAQLLMVDFAGYDAITVGLYSVPPSLRGRRIADTISVGWYTHRDNQRLDVIDPASAETWGHDNALVFGGTDSPSGRVLAAWFDREFDRLWSHRLTYHGTDVWTVLHLED